MIIQLDEAKRTLNAAKEPIADLRNALRIDDLERQIQELEAKTLIPDFWSQPDSGKILQSIKDKKATVEEYGGLHKAGGHAPALRHGHRGKRRKRR